MRVFEMYCGLDGWLWGQKKYYIIWRALSVSYAIFTSHVETLSFLKLGHTFFWTSVLDRKPRRMALTAQFPSEWWGEKSWNLTASDAPLASKRLFPYLRNGESNDAYLIGSFREANETFHRDMFCAWHKLSVGYLSHYYYQEWAKNLRTTHGNTTDLV